MTEKRPTFSHLAEDGSARMVDVSEKRAVLRKATAEGRLYISPATREALGTRILPKGSPIEVARLAGIQAAKKTSDLIPLCHTIQLDFADVEIKLEEDHFQIEATVTCRRATGVEMEALTAVSVAALTLYDMCKSVDQKMRIDGVRLLEKTKRELP